MQDFSESDYRSKYKAYYGIDFDDSFVIHHIDFDHSNNDIDNLILLPRTLHSSYHEIVTELQDYDNPRNDGTVSFRVDNQALFFNKHRFKKMSSLFTKINDWVALKNQGYYKIPTVKIELKNEEVVVCL